MQITTTPDEFICTKTFLYQHDIFIQTTLIDIQFRISRTNKSILIYFSSIFLKNMTRYLKFFPFNAWSTSMVFWHSFGLTVWRVLSLLMPDRRNWKASAPDDSGEPRIPVKHGVTDSPTLAIGRQGENGGRGFP